MNNTIVVFASGGGTNFQSILNAIRDQKLAANVSGLIASRAGIGAAKRAESAGIPVFVYDPSSYPTETEAEKDLLNQLKKWSPVLLVLAGYLRKIPPSIIQSWPGRILNIHPSLLPKYGGKGFYGIRVHQAVIENRDEKSGCTVHLVTENYDEGRILAQVTVPVRRDDSPETLAARILKEEHRIYPEIIQQQLESQNK